MSTNIVVAAFGGSKVVRTAAAWQWDYGQILRFEGLDLPNSFQVHFSNQNEVGTAKEQIGTNNEVEIPYEYLKTGQTIYAWVFLHAGANDGETVYAIIIPVNKRPQPTDEPPTPAEQTAIDQAIAALNAGVQAAQEAAESAEEAVANVQQTVDNALEAAKESGEFDGEDGVSPTATVTPTTTGATITVTDAQGTTTAQISNGQDGKPGTPGAPGTDGISPTITVTDITGGHRVTITDATGPHSFDVMDGDSAEVPVQDVQVNGVSVLRDGVANVPAAVNRGATGVVKINQSLGITEALGTLTLSEANLNVIKPGVNGYYAVSPKHQHESTFYGLAKAAGDSTQSASSNSVGQYTESAKSAISEMLSGSVSVSGTTPTINALPGIRYVCGEVTTIDITLPASGIVDVVFTSGSTPAVLTVTPPTGQTMKWANGWDGVCEANTTYEINIADGVYGVVGQWS